MAGYGSGIGLGAIGGLGVGGAGGGANSMRTPNIPGSMYSPKVRRGMGNWGVHHYLWLLVFLEVAALVALRVLVFKPYHAG